MAQNTRSRQQRDGQVATPSLLRTLIFAAMVTASIADFCDVDPKKAMFYATAVGRATNHFFKRCYPMFSHVVSIKMDNMMLNGFGDFTCANMEACVDNEKMDMNKVHGKVYSEEDTRLILEGLRCMADVLPNYTVMKYLIVYFRKITGR